MRRRAFRGSWAGVSLACIAFALAAACVPATSSTAPRSQQAGPTSAMRGGTLDTSLGKGAFTSEGSDVYNLTRSAGVVTASAPTTNRGGNTRMGFWRAAELESLDQVTCASWTEAPDGLQQHGAVLRTRSASGRTSAITVTRNIYFGAWWIFNVHVMDSASAEPFHQIASFDLREIFRPGPPDAPEVPPYPWRMCARVVGSVVSFIVWPTTHAKPAWNDARYGGSVTLPAGWSTAGKPGWYIGHLEPGKGAKFGDLSVMGLLPNQTPASQQAAAAELAKPATPPVQPTWIAEAP